LGRDVPVLVVVAAMSDAEMIEELRAAVAAGAKEVAHLQGEIDGAGGWRELCKGHETLIARLTSERDEAHCPKCGSIPTFRWHAKAKDGEHASRQYDRCYWSAYQRASGYTEDEHLHYFCKCGFDWIGPITPRAQAALKVTP
jgi:hypothetical protein